MGNLAAFLASFIGPLINQLVLAFGISIISYRGIDFAFQKLIDYFISNWSALPQSILMFATLLGLPTGFSMVLGVLSARLAMIAASFAFSKVVVK